MIKQYIKQAFYLLKENKLISFISIVGTAFAIAMIMVITILFQIKNADYRPEVNRSRTLYIQFGESFMKDNPERRNSINFFLSLDFMKECILPLKTPERVTLISRMNVPLSIPSGNERIPGMVKYTDTSFDGFYDFNYLAGGMFSEADFQSGVKKAVIREYVARQLFHTTDVVGREIYIDGIPFTVCGVIENFSRWASFAFADVYAPYTYREQWWGDDEQIQGNFTAMILAKSPDDFEAIRREINMAVERFNQHQTTYTIGLREQPYSHFQQLFFRWGDGLPDVTENVARYGIILLILLLVPAINLSGLTLSRMQRRMEEIGVRKAFGATRWQLMNQVLSENLLLTLLGGLLGLVLSYIALFLMKDWLLDGGKFISFEMIASPLIFLLAFLFCLLMNLLSAGIPAWSVARKNITDALK